MKTVKTPFLRLFRKIIANSTTNSTANELDTEINKNYSRRQFIETTAKATALVGIASSIPLLNSCKFANQNNETENKTTTKSDYKIAIIGGGIAGLHACHILKKNGITATIYEGSNRTGGRMLSAHNVMGNNLVTEFGGEYLDTTHTTIFSLMDEFGLEKLDTFPSLDNLKIDTIFIDGKHYTIDQAIIEFNKINKKIKADLDKIGDNYEIGSYAATLDNLSIDEYLVKIGCNGWFKKFIQVAYESEFGCSTAELSALNLITFIDTDTSKNEFKYFGDSDERYKVKGGNQQIVDKLAYLHKESIIKEHILTKVDKIDQSYKLTFANGKEVTADYVIMTIPFTMLRKVELNIPMSNEKKNAIQNLNYGTNAKMMFGMNKRIWREQGFGGYLFNNVVQNGWDNSLAQNNNEGYGGYTVFLGGAAGKNMNNTEYDKYLTALDKAYPGTKAQHNSKKAIMHWPTQPFVLGSYACFTKGQITGLLPHIATPIDNFYFAGEHCSEAFQGFMEGAAETGQKVAELIAEKVKSN